MSISIILAAGEGTRMKSKSSKVLHKVCNKPILEYVIESSKKADIKKHIVVVGENKEEVEERFSDEDIIFKEQPIGEEYPYGTGYAVMQALDEIEDEHKVLILYGDTPLITADTVEKLMDYHVEKKHQATVLTAVIEDPTGYGRIVRTKEGCVKEIVEDKDANPEEKAIKEVNSGIYVFDGKLLKESLMEIDDNNSQNEYYVTDVIGILKDKGYNVGACLLEDADEIYGVNSRDQLAFCEQIMRNRINEKHMDNGVTLINPDHTYIDSDVEIGRDTIIYPGISIEGKTKIGSDCIIRGNSRIVESKISDNVYIESSTIEYSQVDSGTNIGPYSHLRPDSIIGKDVRIGNFVEIKNATLEDGSKAAHLAYIGDADIGKDVNIGCGVVFVNYDGKNKHRSIVKDKAFIGSNSNILSPIVVEEHGFIAAGSTITDSVDKGELAIARARQTGKKGWVKRDN